MAITYQSGSIYATSTGQLVTGRVKVAYIMFCPHSNGDEVVLRDGTSGSDPIKFDIHGSGSYATVFLDFSNKPVVFADGIYCSVLSANCHLTIVLTNEGGK